MPAERRMTRGTRPVRSNPLRAAVKGRFYPFAESRGFVREKSHNPLFILFRRTTDTAVHVFELQWEKYGRPCFVINFGEGPSGESIGRLQPRQGAYLRHWFHIRKPWLEAIATMKRSYEPEQVVDQLIALFPELEAWWDEKRVGPHLRFTRHAG